ncbi:MAG: hypothetical protein ABIH82_05915 [Candidatus Woesearchaeota archaeon]
MIEEIIFGVPITYFLTSWGAGVVSSKIDRRFSSTIELDDYVQARLNNIPEGSRPVVHCLFSDDAEARKVDGNEFNLKAYSVNSAKHELGHILGGHLNGGNLDERGLGAVMLYNFFYEPMATFAELRR